jgi:ubiquinone/menaquinone biosynthesis C-methylase UbiE
MSISFDRIADRYDATRGFPDDVAGLVGRGLARAVVPRFGARLLEIGVGTGRVAVPLIQHLPRSVRYTGVDISPAMLALLRTKLPPDALLELFEADVTSLPFGSERFDAVIAVHILHLVSSAHQAVAEAWRVLRRGGLFMSGFNDYVRPDPIMELRHHRWNEILADLGAPPSGRIQRDEIDALLLAAFGRPREITLATWREISTPRAALDQIASRTWSATWHVPDPILAEALRRAESWARERFGDLERPLESQAQFRVLVYRK